MEQAIRIIWRTELIYQLFCLIRYLSIFLSHTNTLSLSLFSLSLSYTLRESFILYLSYISIIIYQPLPAIESFSTYFFTSKADEVFNDAPNPDETMNFNESRHSLGLARTNAAVDRLNNPAVDQLNNPAVDRLNNAAVDRLTANVLDRLNIDGMKVVSRPSFGEFVNA